MGVNEKKIVQVLYSGLGGHATVAFSLLDGFSKNGFENYFIFYGIEPLSETYSSKLDKQQNVAKYYAIQKRTKLGLIEWWKYYTYLNEIRPDIILLHSRQLILVSYLYKLFRRVQIVSVEHDPMSIRTKLKWIVTNLNSIFADRSVVLTQKYKEQVKEKLWFQSNINKYVVIPNGIDIDQYSAKDNSMSENEITIFMAARVNKLKDQETLINAVIDLNKKGYKIQLRLAGDGDTLPELKEKYKSIENVSFLGNIDEDEIIEELHNTDIYVHSTTAETFSTAILQAMSCGLPIITTNIEGTRHMIDDNYNGLLFELKDTLDLEEKILILMKDKDKAKVLAKNARNDVATKYNNNIVCEKYLTVFKD